MSTLYYQWSKIRLFIYKHKYPMTDQIFQLACDIRKITYELGWAKKMWEQHPWIYKNYLQLMRYGDNTKLRVLVNLRQFIEAHNYKVSN